MRQDAPCAVCDERGHKLYGLNAEAVLQRYDRPEDVQEYRCAVVSPPLIQQLKSLSCLIYQCSEGNVPQTALYQSLVRRKIDLTNEIVCNSEEYDRADWD